MNLTAAKLNAQPPVELKTIGDLLDQSEESAKNATKLLCHYLGNTGICLTEKQETEIGQITAHIVKATEAKILAAFLMRRRKGDNRNE